MTRKEYIDELRAGVTNYALTVKQAIEAAYKHADETNPNGWHPVSELPVIPEGKNWVKVVALVDFGDNTLRPRHEIYKDKGWSKKDMWTVKWWCYPPKEE